MKVIFFVIIFVCQIIKGQQFFEPVQPSGLPYLIVVDTIVTNDIELPENSEIGVFDDSLCVGAKIIESKFPFSIVAWEGSQQYGLNGFKSGDSIFLEIYLPFEGDTILQKIEPEYIVGNGKFGYGVYSEISIRLVVNKVMQESRTKKNDELDLYPNPSNSGVNIVLPETFSPKNISIYNIVGQKVFADKLENTDRTYFWNCLSQNNSSLNSGTYFVVLSNKNKKVVGKFLLLK